MPIVKHYKIFFIFSGILILLSILSLIMWQLNFGIDFTGGSLMEIKWINQRPDNQKIKHTITNLGIEDVSVKTTQEKGMILRFKDIGEEKHIKILNNLKEDFGPVKEERFESIGPVIGEELKNKAIWSISIALIVILIFVAWAFRRISFPVKSYKYGIIAVIALFHDVLIVVGVFSALGHLKGIEIGVPFVAALLTVLGYSVNDSIVVFDRIRENLLDYKHQTEEFKKVIGKSLRQTLTRSINTSLTTILVLFAIFLFGGASIHYFVLALILGIILGTYSSLFIASPLLMVWERKNRQ